MRMGVGYPGLSYFHLLDADFYDNCGAHQQNPEGIPANDRSRTFLRRVWGTAALTAGKSRPSSWGTNSGLDWWSWLGL